MKTFFYNILPTMRRNFIWTLFFGAFLSLLTTRTVAAQKKSPADCNFDSVPNEFCAWHIVPLHAGVSFESSTQPASIWHTGDAVLVDAANFVTHDDDELQDGGQDASSPRPRSSTNSVTDGSKPRRFLSVGGKRNRFAYVQGRYGADSEALLESPSIAEAVSSTNGATLTLSYWKVEPQPALDICVKNIATSFAYGLGADDSLNCLDSIAGPGQHQWIRRSIELPPSDVSYKIVLRARGILSAEDIICIDDIQLITNRIADGPANNYEKTMRRAQPQRDAFAMGYRQYQLEDPTASDNQLLEDFKDERMGINASDFDGQGLELLQSSPAAATTEDAAGTGEAESVKIQQQRQKSSIRPQKKTSTPLTVFAKRRHGNNSTAAAHAAVALKDDQARQKWSTNAARSLEHAEICRAIKCSFLEDSCLWMLGSTWKRPSGSIVRDTPGEDYVQSVRFKVPLGAFFEFDLWMSDDSHFMVIEEMPIDDSVPLLLGTIQQQLRYESVILFSQRGMSATGFNRFRIPLRSSFRPVRLRLKSVLPEANEAFVTVSNTRMVDAKNDELMCETMPADTSVGELMADDSNVFKSSTLENHATVTGVPPLASFASLFSATLPPPLPFPTLLPPTQLLLPTPPDLFNLFPPPTTTVFPLLVGMSPLAQHQPPSFPTTTATASTLLFPMLAAPQLNAQPPTTTAMIAAAAAPIFNPFKPMLERGLVPIVPVKADPTRLTAFQKPDEAAFQNAHKPPKEKKLFVAKEREESDNKSHHRLLSNNKYNKNNNSNNNYVDLNNEKEENQRGFMLDFGDEQQKESQPDSFYRLRDLNPTDENAVVPLTVWQSSRTNARASGDKIHSREAQLVAQQKQAKIVPTSYTNAATRSLEAVISSVTGGQPLLTQQLLQLAKQLNIRELPRDAKILEKLGGIFGVNLPKYDGGLPASVSSSTLNKNNDGSASNLSLVNVSSLFPQFFTRSDAPQMTPQLFQHGAQSSATERQQLREPPPSPFGAPEVSMPAGGEDELRMAQKQNFIQPAAVLSKPPLHESDGWRNR